jgi:hypothetical protein
VYVTTDAITGEKELHRPSLVWIDLETGREMNRCPLVGPRHVQPRVGPMFVVDGRLWAFTGIGNDLARDFVELVVKDHGLLATRPAKEWETWTRGVPARVRAAAERVLPGWIVFNGQAHPRTGLVEEYQGQRDVLCAAAPFVIGRHLDVPATDKPRLMLRVTNEPKGQCLIAVDVNGKQVWQQPLNSATTGDGWKDWEVDLSAYKGKRIWVVARHASAEPATTTSYWNKIELRE